MSVDGQYIKFSDKLWEKEVIKSIKKEYCKAQYVMRSDQTILKGLKQTKGKEENINEW